MIDKLRSKVHIVLHTLGQHKLSILVPIVLLCLTLVLLANGSKIHFCDSLQWLQWLANDGRNLLWLLLFIFLAFFVCSFEDAFSEVLYLHSHEERITMGKTIKLIFILLPVVMAFVFYAYDKSGKESALTLTIVGTLLAWIFQDSVRGVIAFYHLRSQGLLHIGDWIKVDKYGVDGTIKTIGLTVATVENWDTTVSSLPLAGLLSEQVQNLQQMVNQQTQGRRMLRSFIIDTGWIHPLTEREVSNITSNAPKTLSVYVERDVVVGVSNMKAFRNYIDSYLRNHEQVSHQPRLMVRWMEPTSEGIPLQVYAYLRKTKLEEFEKLQSELTEHIINSMALFGLRLYQSPSGYDASNSNIFMTKNEATYGKD